MLAVPTVVHDPSTVAVFAWIMASRNRKMRTPASSSWAK